MLNIINTWFIGRIIEVSKCLFFATISDSKFAYFPHLSSGVARVPCALGQEIFAPSVNKNYKV